MASVASVAKTKKPWPLPLAAPLAVRHYQSLSVAYPPLAVRRNYIRDIRAIRGGNKPLSLSVPIATSLCRTPRASIVNEIIDRTPKSVTITGEDFELDICEDFGAEALSE